MLLDKSTSQKHFRASQSKVQAASLPRASCSIPDTSRDSDLSAESKLSMAPSIVASAAPSPSKSESVSAQEKEQAEVQAEAGTPLQKPALNKRRRDRNSKRKPKPKKRDEALCVGYYIDALDKKMLWGEARIIQCNLTSQKIKVHFVGWSSNYDLWTDAMSITAHGRYASRTKDRTVKSWDGDMHLFEDMLGKIDDATITPMPAPTENKKRVALLSASAKKKAGEIKKAPSATRARHTERLTLKRKADVGRSRKKTISERKTTTSKAVESSGHSREHDQRSKHAVAMAKAKKNTKEKRKPLQSSKKQKREGQQLSASTTSKARPLTQNGAVSPDDLPLFRNLELDDGTVLDLSVQRENARMEREAMRSFLDKCALIWKNQLSIR